HLHQNPPIPTRGTNPGTRPATTNTRTQERPKKKQTLSQEEAYQTQPELSKYHTYDLLLLLSYLREQRSTAYKTMQSVRKAPNEVKTSRNDYDELNEYGQEFYREATARKNIIEQIL